VAARAAVLLTALVAQVHLVHDLQEGRLGSSGLGTVGVGLVDGDEGGALGALAALGLLSGLAGGLLALQLALGLGAVGGLDALVRAFEFLADRGALGLGGGASGVALSRRADGLALGAGLLLAIILGATDRAHRTLAVNGALGARSLLALHLADGALANGVADSRAGGVIALPFAVGVALLSSSHGQEGEQGNSDEGAHGVRGYVLSMEAMSNASSTDRAIAMPDAYSL